MIVDTIPLCMLGTATVNTADVIMIIALAFLIMCSAFFSASETAFSTVNTIRLRNMAEEKVKGARRALYISEHFEKVLSTILVGNNLVNIASTTICAVLFGKFILNPTLANVMNTVVMTIIILICGEITPKAFAKMAPEKFTIKFSGIMHVIILILWPISTPFYFLQRTFTKRARIADEPTITEEELESIIDTMEEEGVIDENNADIIQNAIKLADITAYDIMTPRVDMVCASVADEIENVKKLFIESNYSRLPIYDGTRDNIVGIINQKDFFAALLQNKQVKLKQVMKQPVFVPENMKVDDLIRTMQKNKFHMTIVVDEHGGTSGIATMEDCLEYMVGEIYDEHDEVDVAPMIEKQEDGTYVLNADVTLEELFEVLEIEHLPKTDYTTLSGFLFEISENMLEEGSEIIFKTIDDVIDKEGMLISKPIEMKFLVTKMEQNRLNQVKLEIL